MAGNTYVFVAYFVPVGDDPLRYLRCFCLPLVEDIHQHF